MSADFIPVFLLAASGIVGLLLIPLGLPGIWLLTVAYKPALRWTSS